MRDWPIRFWQSLSAVGLLLATLFFAASLTPSLVPRPFVLQGVLSGLSLAAGYGLGALAEWIWDSLQLRRPSGRLRRFLQIGAAVILAVVAATFLWKASEWQNSIRVLMDLPPVDSAHPTKVGLIALAVFALMIALARIFQIVFRLSSRALARFAPGPVAMLAGAAIATFLFWSIADGIFFHWALRAADASFKQLDALIEEDIPRPTDPNKTGSSASLIKWRGLGRQGRAFVATGPTQQDIGNFLQRDAMEPIRVYAGLNSAETPEERAQLALAELKRVGGFERSSLLVIVPTGTGWVDPAASNSVEYLHGGDIASIAVQYSYLTSWLSLLVEPDYGSETSRALFHAVYDYWTKLPKDTRPKLYLHGLSLGALNSELSVELLEVVGDPFQGALWSGPPFPSPLWGSVTRRRVPDSPSWLPRFGNGSVVRFTSQQNALNIPGANWGAMRIVYLQYASDAVTFFDPRSIYQAPSWMVGPRGPDVSPELRWYPVVTFLQLLLDLATATTTPIGHGHVYAPQHYIDAWIAVTDVQGWSTENIERLKVKLAKEMP
ncbi:alpha/beta hydrolase [Arvimicrobium flavum]|uniref:alpha/beta hydrolase n=1 Tax=Arvimicrobium flavum TaxID=3393320 RepID=UPI00237B8045|nr:alpha/beta-hydrolase family protein [Mesorhizobium shangrilense]